MRFRFQTCGEREKKKKVLLYRQEEETRGEFVVSSQLLSSSRLLKSKEKELPDFKNNQLLWVKREFKAYSFTQRIMADFVSSSSSPSSNLLSQISSLLSSMRSNPKDNQIFTQAFQLINTNYTSLTQSHSHPFCHFNGQSPPLEGHLQTAMLRTFGLEKCAEVDSWIEGIGKSIYACRECYVGFEEARERLTSE